VSTILAVYTQLPKFPATDQDPAAQRFQFGSLWFDVLNGPLVQAEADVWNAASAAAAAIQAAQPARIDSFVTDGVRAELVALLKTGTPLEIETYVRGKINADAVTNLATAITFAKRTETALVQVAKAISLIVKN